MNRQWINGNFDNFPLRSSQILSWSIPTTTRLPPVNRALHDGAVMDSADLPLPPTPQPLPQAFGLPFPPPLPGEATPGVGPSNWSAMEIASV